LLAFPAATGALGRVALNVFSLPRAELAIDMRRELT
jgi:hypothetical protein